MHLAFLVALTIVAVALAASVFIEELPLCETMFADEDTGSQTLDGTNRSIAEGVRTPSATKRGKWIARTLRRRLWTPSSQRSNC